MWKSNKKNTIKNDKTSKQNGERLAQQRQDGAYLKWRYHLIKHGQICFLDLMPNKTILYRPSHDSFILTLHFFNHSFIQYNPIYFVLYGSYDDTKYMELY